MRFRVVLVALVFAACAGPARLRPPDPPVELENRGFGGLPEEAAGKVLAHRWWSAFGDRGLDELVERAVKGNLDLRRAVARIAEARAAAARAGAVRVPAVTGSASAQRSRAPGKVVFGERVTDRYDLSAFLAYEVDLWGRLANLEEATRLDLEAAREDAKRAYHLLVAEVVRAWLDLAGALERADVARRTLVADRQRLAVAEIRFQRGLVSATDVHQALRQVSDARARKAAFEQQAELARHRLRVLLGEYPGKWDDLAPELPAVPGPVPAGLPSELLWRRPDLRAAARRYLGARARAAAADADRFPRLALTASGGRASEGLRNLALGTSAFWNLIANLTQPLFDAGARRAALAEAEARAEQAFLAWGQAVLTALREVEDALSMEEAQRRRLAALQGALRHARQALGTAEIRYRRGLEEITRALLARETLLAAELAEVEARHALLLNRVSLYLALGGTWGHEAGVVGAAAPSGGHPTAVR